MKAVILAAGRGSRLAPITDSVPKGLINVGEETIAERMVRILHEQGIDLDDICFVTGYKSECYEKLFAHTLHNVDWDTCENYSSVLLALEEFNDNDFLFLDSDLLFAPDVIKAVLECEHPNVLTCMLSDDLKESTGVIADGHGRVLRIGKDIEGSGLIYTSIFKLSRNASFLLRDALKCPRNQNTWYTASLNDIFDRVPFHALVSDAAWCEVDDLDDYHHAQSLIEEGILQ